MGDSPQLYDKVELKNGQIGRLIKRLNSNEFVFMSGEKLETVTWVDVNRIVEKHIKKD